MSIQRCSASLNLLKLSINASKYSPIICEKVSGISKYSYFVKNNVRQFHQTQRVMGMDEFFEEPDNWGAREVRVGRGWKIEEMRIKSNDDLHKLWYVLLKELNMLLTMEYASKQENVLFPNPERIDKVRDSMGHIETLVRERNRAYWQLETGETGDRPGGVVKDMFGRVGYQEFTECATPKDFNPTYQKFKYIESDILEEMNKEYREVLEKREKRNRQWDAEYVTRIFNAYPDADAALLQEEYPDLDIEAIRNTPEARGNHPNAF